MKLFFIWKGGICLEILSGDVLFVWGNGPIEQTIEWVTHGPSHCAIFIDSKTVAECQWDKKTGSTPITEYLSDKGNRLEVWRDESLTEKEKKRIVDYAKQQYGIEYDYLAILAELARFELSIPISSFHEGKKRICSSYVNDCGKSVGRNWTNISYAPAPVDLIKGGKLTRKGVLSNGK
jgi:hypothetical protein